nr:CDP-archaeol synthase [Endobacter medicaginis]
MAEPALTASGATASGSWRDLRLRLVSAAVAGLVGLGCLWLGGPMWLLLVIGVAAGLAWEWVGLCGLELREPPSVLFGAGIAVAIGDYLVLDDGLGAAMVPAVLAASLLVALYRTRSGVALAAGCLVIPLAALCLVWLRRGDAAPVLVVLLTVWASDSGAYLVGRKLGGPKLAPSISPGKTRSGAMGGLVCAMAVCALAAAWLHPTPLTPGLHAVTRLVIGVLLGGLLGISAQLGDLAESWFKRRSGVKDSGTLLPGHGGLLDRLDGLLAALPVAVVAIFLLAAINHHLHPLPLAAPASTGGTVTDSPA